VLAQKAEHIGSREPIVTTLSSPSAPTFTMGTSISGASNSAPVPPDTTIAAGPTDVVEATNDAVESWTKSGGEEFYASLGGFFSSVTGDTNYITDPQAAYDPYINRFWVTATASNDAKSESKLLLALSMSSAAPSLARASPSSP
jgi:hypothetical protein